VMGVTPSRLSCSALLAVRSTARVSFTVACT